MCAPHPLCSFLKNAVWLSKLDDLVVATGTRKSIAAMMETSAISRHKRHSVEIEHPALILFTEPTTVISQMTLINGEKILVRDDTNGEAGTGGGMMGNGLSVVTSGDHPSVDSMLHFTTCSEMDNLQILLQQQSGDQRRKSQEDIPAAVAKKDGSRPAPPPPPDTKFSLLRNALTAAAAVVSSSSSSSKTSSDKSALTSGDVVIKKAGILPQRIISEPVRDLTAVFNVDNNNNNNNNGTVRNSSSRDRPPPQVIPTIPVAPPNSVVNGILNKVKFDSSRTSNNLHRPAFIGSSNGIKRGRTGGGGGSGNGGLDSNGGGGSGSSKLLHFCHVCNKGFKDRYSVNVHVRTHTGEKPFSCLNCGKCFRQKAHLLKHMSIHKRISRD